MPGYIKKKLQEYGHVVPNRLQSCPYAPEPKKFEATAQAPAPPNDTPKLNDTGIKRVHTKNCGKHIILCPCHGHDSPHGPQLHRDGTTKATDWTLERCIQLLDYLAGNNPAKVRFHASDTIMNIHSAASYLSAPGQAQSRTCGHFFMGLIPKDNKPI